jgi:rubredoxin
MSDEPETVHVCGNDCGHDKPEDLPNTDVCPDCQVQGKYGYGLAAGGIGAYTYCPQCYRLLQYMPDPDM